MKINHLYLLGATLLAMAVEHPAWAQQYNIDVSTVRPRQALSLPMQGVYKKHSFNANSSFFIKDGRPWFPVMGEIHYNRVLPQDWEREIQKMKSNGLSIVATYIFWNEHETAPGVWDWKANRNLRQFIEVCQKNGMYVWLRIGPWSHGEQKWGGFPDWIQEMSGKRRNDPAYMAEAAKLYHQISLQTQGLFFSQGGPVIGCQLENEYASGDKSHITRLKNMALAAGIKPVFWTITANSIFEDKLLNVIPLQGAYAYRGWEKSGGKATNDFVYGDDQWIMTEAIGTVLYDVNRYPKGMCEQGAGSQMTYPNRFVVEPEVIAAHAQNQIGRGMNLMGYYMFHGGTQTPGLEEGRLPVSYDFQAPIGEFGEIKPSYRALKPLHYFINDFGTELAQMNVVESPAPVKDQHDTKDLRYIARSNGTSGYLFLCNTQVRIPMPDKKVQMTIKTKQHSITLPAFVLKGETTAIIPFNMNVDGLRLNYVMAQPFARIKNGKVTTIFFQKLKGVEPQLAVIADGQYTVAEGTDWGKTSDGQVWRLKTRSASQLSFRAKDGRLVQLIFLTEDQAGHALKFSKANQQAFAYSNADPVRSGNKIELINADDNKFSLTVFPRGVITANKISSNKWSDSFSFSSPEYTQAISVTYPDKKTAIIKLPEHASASVTDLILDIKYRGGEAEVFQNNKKITDDLFNGQNWRLGTHRFRREQPIVIKLKDWSNDITGVADNIVEDVKKRGAGFDHIKLRPSYRCFVDLNN